MMWYFMSIHEATARINKDDHRYIFFRRPETFAFFPSY